MKNFEIERKFLVKTLPNLDGYKRKYIRQGYISTNPVIRVRQQDDNYIFTFKGKGDIKRLEIETKLSKEEFDNLWDKIEGNSITKYRYIIPLYDNFVAELDIYQGDLKGFINVEVEFETLEQANNFKVPSWFGDDITKDIRYTNAYLSKISKKL